MTVGHHVAIEIDRAAIESFCQKWRIKEFALFGSVLTGEFRPASDVDVLVTFEETTKWTLWDWQPMTEELEQIFHRPVDLVEKRAVEKSENYIRRKHILANFEPIYVAR